LRKSYWWENSRAAAILRIRDSKASLGERQTFALLCQLGRNLLEHTHSEQMKLLTQTPPPLPPTSVDDSHFFGKQMRKQRQTTQKSMLYKYAMCASCLSVCVRPSVCVPSWGSVCVRLSVYIYYGQDGRQGSQCVLERHINYTTFWGHPRNPSTRREFAYKNKRTSKFR